MLNPVRQFGVAGPGADAMRFLRREVLDRLVLRRTKAGRAADLALPTRTIIVRNDIQMDATEKDFYQALYTQSRTRLSAFADAGVRRQRSARPRACRTLT